MKSTQLNFLAGIVAGFVAAILFAPMSGAEARKILFTNENDDPEWDDRETYNINELTASGSSSLDELKRKIESEKK